MAYNPSDAGGKEPLTRTPSLVATTKSRNVIMLGLLGLGLVVFIYSSYFQEDNVKPSEPKISVKEAEAIRQAAVTPVTPVPIALPETEKLPEPPALVAPTPPPPPPTPVAITPPPMLQAPTPIAVAAPIPVAKPVSKISDARLRAPIMMTGNSGGRAGTVGLGAGGDQAVATGSAYQNFSRYKRTSAKQLQASRIGDLANTVAQGKMLEAVLETAINTDVPGKTRAIVVRDIYAEAGKKVLIPRGSRLIGQYAAKVERGQKRLAIAWQRIIRPDGVDLFLDGEGFGIGTDDLGRSGSEGIVDNRYFEVLYNAVMLSTAKVAWSKAAENVTKTGQSLTTTTTAADGSKTVTDSGSATQDAIKDANDKIGQAVDDVAGTGMKTQPTIYIDQGTRLKVFVNQDLVFPSNYNQSMIQVVR
jgi:type IV secretion system protein VirB10